jgi:transcriptional regulator with XRE-family HTH domain
VAKRIGADKERKARHLDEAMGAELTALRTRHGWSQQRLSELTGYDESYVRQLERGTKSATLRTLADLASAFSINVSALIRQAERRLTREPNRGVRLKAIKTRTQPIAKR